MWHTSYEEVCTQEYDTVCEDNGVKQKWKRSAHDDEFVKNLEAMVDELEEEEHDKAVEIIEEKINEPAEA